MTDTLTGYNDLPFTCPFCGEPFGTGSDAALLAVVSEIQIHGEPTPCCGKPFYGSIRKDDHGVLSIRQAGDQS